METKKQSQQKGFLYALVLKPAKRENTPVRSWSCQNSTRLYKQAAVQRRALKKRKTKAIFPALMEPKFVTYAARC